MPDKHEDRWLDWIQTLEYQERLQVVERKIRDQSTDQIDTSSYTPHDATHCLAVENMIKSLIKKSGADLTDLEIFILFSSAWFHDVGMFENVAKDFFNDQNTPESNRSTRTIRDKHDEISAWYLSSKYDEVFRIQSDGDGKLGAIIDNMLRNYAYTINVISQFHRMKEDINECPKERFIKGEKIRTRLLSCFLRLGDTLHVDSSRFDRRLYDVLQIGQLDRSARLHWLKSYVVSNIYLDSENETVFVNIDLPKNFKNSKNNKMDRKQSIKNLENAIINDISDDVQIVRETFREYGLHAFASVKANINFVPGYSEKDNEEISGIISDLDIVFSPNTSKVIEKSLDSIASICNIKFEKAEHFHNQMEQLLSYLKKILEERPCHVGLRTLIIELKEIFDEFDIQYHRADNKDISVEKIKQCQDTMIDKIDGIRRDREIYLEKLKDKCKEKVLLEDFENIILFAYSEMVTSFLSEYGKHYPAWKEEVKLYVLECGGKRRLTYNNNIEYNDGLHYALQLSRHDFKNIKLMPDTSFSSLAYNLKKNNENNRSLVLFGVNGIDEESHDCGHTSGHLMIAITANHFKIYVKVIGDSFKLGPIDWKTEAVRETPWLTGDRDTLSEIKKHNITLTNYVEDRIPLGLINEIIKDNGNITGGQK